VPRLLAAPDKFRGTLTGRQAAGAMARAARAAGWDAVARPISDGGEGLLDCFGGANRHTTFTGPLGVPVTAGWRLEAQRAVIEMAAASGIALVAGDNDPVAATTRGTGELIRAAIDAAADTIVVGAGGSATTDGGWAAVEMLRDVAPLDGSRGVRVVVAGDVRTRFLDAAATFAAQKGATPDQLAELSARLAKVADRYEREFGLRVNDIEGSGAAGGLAGGLAALGAVIRPGFELVADELQLARTIATADLVITGEGRLDASSVAGKATGSLVAMCIDLGVPAVVIAGAVAEGFDAPFAVVDLTQRYGAERARVETATCVETAVRDELVGRTR
jgi:glycerate 2-kinase